jgi:trehalose 6-phosphate phosphatase
MPEPPRIDWDAHALFLDLDGTLAPIAARPGDAAVARETRAALARLAPRMGGALAILSGRPLAEIDRMLAPLTLPAAGSHGAERRDAAGRLAGGGAGAPALAAAAERIGAFATPEGLLVERKAGAVTLHYRGREELAARARASIDAAAADAPELRAIHGHLVSEVALPGAHKGRALAAFMEEPPFAGRAPVAVGDDTTDEDAFAAAQAMGGTGVRIGPGETVARARLPDIGAFLAWLHRLADAAEGEGAWSSA